MGSWNATCGITQHPIFSGQAANLIILRNNQNNSPFIYYACDSWKPVPVALSGTYDSYGYLELDESSMNDFRIIYQKLREQYPEIPEDLDWEKFCNFLHYSDHSSNKENQLFQTFGVMHIHDNVYKALSDKIYYGIREISLSNLLHLSNEFFHLNKRTSNKMEMLSLLDEFRKNYPTKINHTAYYFMQNLIYEMPSIDSNELRIHELSDISTEKLLRFQLLKFNMLSLRKFFSVQAGSGAQSGYSPIHNDLIDAMKQNILDRQNEVLQDCYDLLELSEVDIEEEKKLYGKVLSESERKLDIFYRYG